MCFFCYNLAMKESIKTERLLLRKLQKDDAEAIFQWTSDPEVCRYLTWNAHKSIEVTKTILDQWVKEYENPDCYRYGIVLKEENKLIGMIDVYGYHRGNPVIGYVLNRHYWGKGYMTEAFGAFKEELLERFKTLIIRACKDNVGSNRVIEKNGFRKIGTEKQDLKRNGVLVEVNEYRYLKDGVGRMKVLLINGSPHPKGCTARALREVESTLNEEGIETEFITVGNKAIRGCISCNTCHKNGKCVFDDEVNEVARKFEEADGLVVGSPVYYGHANGTVLAFMDRLFYSTRFSKKMKVGAAVVSSRRAGSTSAFEDLNKYFTITQMPIVSSHYWNEVHGFTAEDVEKDLEGLRTMRNLGRNMAFLLKGIKLARLEYGIPETEKGPSTSFPDGL